MGEVNTAAVLDNFEALGAGGAFAGGGGGGGGGGGATGFSLTTFTSFVLSNSAGGGGGGGGSGATISTGGDGGGGGGMCFAFFCAINCDVVKHTESNRIIFFILVIFSTLMQERKLSIKKLPHLVVEELLYYFIKILNHYFSFFTGATALASFTALTS